MRKISALLFVLLFVFSCTGKPAAPNRESPLFKDPAQPVEKRVEDLLARMTLDEKIGQMLQVDRYQISGISEISRYMVGSVLNGGNANPIPNTPEGWADMYDAVQREAMKTRLAIPVLYGIDAVHGNCRTPGAVVFPHNIGLGAADDPDLTREIGKITAIETRAVGVHWTFAPCIAVPQDIRWGRTYEGFSENPDISASLGAAMIHGLQDPDLKSFDSILACAKHYVGDGGTTGGHDQGNTEVDEKTLRDIHLKPYISAIEAGAGSIMASFSSWNGEKVHGNSRLLTDILRKELGFKGLVVSDWAGVTQLKGSYRNKLEKAINAGIDLIMLPAMPGSNLSSIRQLVKSGKIKETRIDEAVRRILEIKFKLGLFEKPFADRSRLAMIGSAEHRETARRAVRESAVLLKNDALLPLAKNGGRIMVAGSKAGDPGAQCGGWTLMWQGVDGDVPGATSIADALEAAAEDRTVVYSKDGSAEGSFDAIIAVVGEQPYAEGKGDSRQPGLSANEKELVKKLAEKKVPLILIVLSGRPLLMTEQIELSDAVLAAWLPGTEGAGVADIIFGDYSPTGKLSFTWPANASWLDKHDNESVLFPFGYGLEY